MKKRIIDVFLMALTFTVAIGSVVSCKDTDEDEFSKVWAELNENSTMTEAINNRIDQLEGTLASLESAKNDILADIETLKGQVGKIDGIDGRLATAEASLSIIEEGIRQINEALGNAGDPDLAVVFDQLTATLVDVKAKADAVADLQSRVTTNEEEIKKLWEAIDKIDVSGSWNERLQDIADSTAQALALAKADSMRLDAVEGDVDSLMKYVGETLKDAEGNWMTLEEYIMKQREEIIKEIQGEDGEGLTLGDLKKAYEAADQALRDDLDALERRVQNLETKTNDINRRLGLVESILNKFITGVIIQATDNPVYGTFSLPVNVNSRILAAYYGSVEKPISFPTVSRSDYALNDGLMLTEKDLQMLGIDAGAYTEKANRIVAKGGAEGNAGTLYLTINPTNVDATGRIATLENSIGDASDVMLSPLQPSDKKLSFGYTRAGNGFYETKATVSLDAIDNVKPRISMDQLKDLAQSVKDAANNAVNGNGIQVMDILSDLYTMSSDILDAEGVKFSWTDDNGVERSVISDYSLAATAIKPLGYGALKDINVETLPGLEKIENLIGDIFDDVKGALPEFDTDGLNIEIGEIKIDPVNVGKVTTTVVVDMEGVVDATGKPVGDKVVEVDITDAVQDALNDAMGGIQGDLNDFVADLNSQIGQINDLIDQLNQINDLGNSITDVENKLLDYIQKANDKICYWVNNANKVLQPVMFAQTNGSFISLSQSAGAPTMFSASSYNGAITLIPTSYNLEILAPAYKKLIGVTNVFDGKGNSAQGGDQACISALNTANSASADFCTVVDGDNHNFTLSGVQKGYVYEVVYTAVDYSGKVVAKKFYLELK